MTAIGELRDSIEIWPSEIGFVPFIGSNYEQGFDGVRVLLLGESHYWKDSDGPQPTSGALRGLTREVFNDCEIDGGQGRAWGTFFRRLDSIAANREVPTDAEAALGWRHLAFANFVQSLVDGGPRNRPRGGQWKDAKRTFPTLLGLLRPDAVFVLGSQLWSNTPSDGEETGSIDAPRYARTVWTMPYEGGECLMTWAYHPSWSNDTAGTYVTVFQELLGRAKSRKLASKNGPSKTAS